PCLRARRPEFGPRGNRHRRPARDGPGRRGDGAAPPNGRGKLVLLRASGSADSGDVPRDLQFRDDALCELERPRMGRRAPPRRDHVGPQHRRPIPPPSSIPRTEDSRMTRKLATEKVSAWYGPQEAIEAMSPVFGEDATTA